MPRHDRFRFLLPATVMAAVAALPLAGAWSAGRIPPSLWTFPPPLSIPDDYPPCGWAGRALALLAWAALGLGAAWIWRRGKARSPDVPRGPRRPFPAWGWVGLAWTLAWWVLAWTRLEWFAPLQLYTFFPLWAGFIVTVNALTWRRRGRCLMLQAPRAWLLLLVVSAGFWWCFEWMNHFVRNWHYLRVGSFEAAGYAAHGSLCFSTVLPAVLAVREWLGTHPRWFAGCMDGPRWTWSERPRPGIVLIVAGALGLALTGAFPLQAFPAPWTAPLLIALGLLVFPRNMRGCAGSAPLAEGGESGRARRSRRHPFGFMRFQHRRGAAPLPELGGSPVWWSEMARGDWRSAASWAAAALVCGFFWEMWNVFSRAKWIYTIPYLDCWHVFEMPLPGYLGYLTFGLECAIAVHWCRQVTPARA